MTTDNNTASGAPAGTTTGSIDCDVLVVGFGKAGKTIAMTRAKAGDRVVLVEKSPSMYGGTCINVGCVPTKTLLTDAHRHAGELLAATRTGAGAASAGTGSAGTGAGSTDTADSEPGTATTPSHDAAFSAARSHRDSFIGTLNAANHAMVENTGVLVVDGHATFTGPRTVTVTGGDPAAAHPAEQLTVTADTVVINTGSVPVRPPIPGADGPRVLDSTGVQMLPERPRRLAIVGGGPIGLEFATMFAQFGTEVTVLDGSPRLLPRFDRDIADAVHADLRDLGVTVLSGVTVEEIADAAGAAAGAGAGGDATGGDADGAAGGDATTGANADTDAAGGATPAAGAPVTVTYTDADGTRRTVDADHVLLATGRKPATDGLGLDAAGVEVTDRGAVVVDPHLRTTADGVYAAGDVAGSPQFTYVSYDDHRVILSDRWGDGSRTTTGRLIPSTTFLEPPLSQVGLGADAAREDTGARGHTLDVRVQDIRDIAVMPRPKILGQARGRAKILVDREDDRILGATLYCVDSQELINLVTTAMVHGIPASAVGSGIYTHPSSSEVFNALLG
ncbi:dihydrolipoyl dehydrogenase family protein [Corynebacterium bovis]|uniref:dihydrolipoyl dehydrogenase family protein n=1 Tax=Corynebacterium bovis TaxID=36808 RepID=UPI000F64875D|nr:FAD-dependent oxidoreductase [Corynebacterium bovis]RRO80236.1 pyridine nucleotide-disulfide oxidoreductase [Corynebacterium bovis]RRO80705.1 pyridine nucleotide-disulfide oxidoreductase [Corynebacterium bovis]RRO81303.1 pyridine nucleotide-disulfide oxidoreductase [Corynebacterium bovis]RRO88736.1 pyridine nucleotide-disulfide oxidoreductase [Corynebacterium bovis]